MSTEQQTHDRSHLYCPHFDNVDEETLRQLFSKVAAVRSDNRELFDFTHRPIKVFGSQQGTKTEEEIVSEDEVYREFNDSRSGNFTVVIEGEVGTGKSELCAYLAHRLEGDGRPILHVDKNDDLMTLLSERIPEFYEEQFGEELPGASNFKELRRDLKENGSVVANSATSGAILNLKHRGHQISVDVKENAIREYVQDQLSLLVEKGEYAKEIKFVTEQAYRQNDFLQVIEDHIPDEEAVTAFNEELWREIRDRYQTASLGDVLERVGQRFTDTRPVIVFEDFAITAMEGQRLRNYMERDKSEDNWDFVVAGTRDSTQILHTQTAEDRFEFYRTNKQNSNSVLFLNEDSAVSFIRPYLGYFKSFDHSVSYNRGDEELSLELLDPHSGSECDRCRSCEMAIRDLFPFNEAFLRRVYAGLREDEQSPREYVMAVFDVLRDYYDGYVDVPSDAERLSSLSGSLDASTDIWETSDSLANLARWYGDLTDDGIVVDDWFVEVFGLRETAKSIDAVTERDDVVIVPSGSGGGGGRGSEGGGGGGTIGGTGKDVGSRDGLKDRIAGLRPNVQPWQQNPSDFPDINQNIRRGIRDAINRLTNDFELFDNMGLRYNLSSQKDPFIFKSSQQAPDDDQIVIDPQEFRISDLKNLLEFGVYRNENPSKADYDKLLQGIGTQLTGYARDWQTKVKETNLRSNTCLFKQSVSYEFQDFALAGYAYVVLLDSPFEELSAKSLSERFSKTAPYSLDSELQSQLRDELPTDELDSIVTFIDEYGEWFEEMVGSFFGANESTLDIPVIRGRIQMHSPYEVLSGLGRQYIGRISPRVRFDTNSKLRDIADQAYDVQSALEKLEDEYRSDVVHTFVDKLSSVQLSNIEEIVETLQTYDSVDTEMIESLKKFVSLNQSDVDTTVEAAELASELIHRSNEERLQGILISLKLGETAVYQRHDKITLVGGGQQSGFGDRFQSVGTHYVN